MSTYEFQMRGKIESSIQKVNTILENNRGSKIQSARSVPHLYSDKFLLVDTVTNIACVSQVHCLAQIGLTKSLLKAMKSWSTSKTVSLRFSYNRKTTLLREIEREVEDPTSIRTTRSSTQDSETMTVVTKVKEHVYLEEQTHQLVAFSGVGDNAAEFLTVFDRNGSSERTSTYRSEDSHSSNSQDVDMSWLLQVLSSEVNGAEFAIDRSDAHCITPTNNKDTDAAKQFFKNLGVLFSAIENEMWKWEDVQPNFPQVAVSEVKFSPLVTLFETRTNGEDTEPRQVSLSSSTVTAMVEEYRRELAELCAGIVAALPASSTEEPVAALFTVNELVLATVAYEIAALQSDYFDAVTGVDEMVRAQLVAEHHAR